MAKKKPDTLTKDFESMDRRKLRSEAYKQSRAVNADEGYTGRPTRGQLEHNERALTDQAWGNFGKSTVDAVMPKKSTHDMNSDVPHPMTKKGETR